jgi:hypothetical protein
VVVALAYVQDVLAVLGRLDQPVVLDALHQLANVGRLHAGCHRDLMRAQRFVVGLEPMGEKQLKKSRRHSSIFEVV